MSKRKFSNLPPSVKLSAVTPDGSYWMSRAGKEDWERTLEMAEAVESEGDRSYLRHEALRQLGVVRG